MSWLDLFMDECEFVETPRNWLWWSGIATVSAIVSPNIEVQKGAYQLRPNLYILLIGRSGLGKGFGPSLAKKLVDKVGSTRVISGRGTIEGIVKELSIVKAKENGHVPFKDARGFLCSGEFAASLYEATHALTILTDLYDGHYNPTWDNTLKNSPIERLRDVCLTLLSGANPDMFDLAIDKHHRGGGFVGRTLLISADKRYRANSMIYAEGEDVQKIDEEKLASYLHKVSKLKGQMIWSVAAKKKYNEWFYPYRDADVEDKTGTYDRLNDHIIKVATCISLARKDNMVLESDDIEEAIAACSDLSNTAKKVAGVQGKSTSSDALKSFLMIMFSATESDYTLSRKKVLQKGFGDFDSIELDRVVESLSQMGFITQPAGNKDIKYRLTPACVKWWESSIIRRQES